MKWPWLLAVVTLACGGEPAAPAPAPATDRGVPYDAVYFDLTDERIAADLDFIAAQGVTSIYVSCNDRDLGDLDKLRRVVKAGHARGMRVFVDPYLGGVFSFNETDAGSRYNAAHPEQEVRSRTGAGGGVPSINNPAFRAYLEAALRVFFTLDFDGVLLDEPWYPVAEPPDYFPYDAASRALFQTWYGHDMPATADAEVEAFRQRSMVDFHRQLFDLVKSLRPSATTILVVQGASFTEPDVWGTRDWRALASIPSLDVFQIDPYWYPAYDWDWFVANIDRLLTETAGVDVLVGAWVAAYGLPDGYDRISRSLTYLRERRIPWLAAWITDAYPNADQPAAWAEIRAVFTPTPAAGGTRSARPAPACTAPPRTSAEARDPGR